MLPSRKRFNVWSFAKRIFAFNLFYTNFFWDHPFPLFIFIQISLSSFRVFPTRGIGGLSPLAKKFSYFVLVESPHQRLLSPTTEQKFSSYSPIKTSFLAMVIAPVQFFIVLSYSVHTAHANFDFNWCLIFTECCF